MASAAEVREIGFDARVADLLAACGLPVEDVSAASPVRFFAAGDGQLLGVVGLEGSGTCALLRSLAVAPEYRGHGLGAVLLQHAEAAAGRRGVTELYLLTTTAQRYFAARGYAPVARTLAPPAIAAMRQFRELCPASAAFMLKRLPGSRRSG